MHWVQGQMSEGTAAQCLAVSYQTGISSKLPPQRLLHQHQAAEERSTDLSAVKKIHAVSTYVT